MTRALALALVCFGVVVLAPLASQAQQHSRSRVVLVRGADESPALEEVLIRLQAEMTAAGFDAVLVDSPPNSDPRSLVEQHSHDEHTFTAIAVLQAGPSSVDVWIGDYITGKTTVRRVSANPNLRHGSTASVLALRSVELLRASLLEIAGQEPSPAPPDDPSGVHEERHPPPEDVVHFAEQPIGPPRRFYSGGAAELAAAGLYAVGGVGASLGPALRFSYGSRAGVFGRATVLGPALMLSDLQAPEGSATLRQEFALLEVGYSVDIARSPLALFATVGVGPYHAVATGTAMGSYQGSSAEVWSVVADASIGLALRLGARVAIVLDAQVLYAEPHPVVQIAGNSVGSAMAPSLASSLGLLVAF